MKTGIAGSGVMGSGIAMCSILAGYETILYDIQDTALERSKKYIEAEMEKSVAKGKLQSEARDQALKLLSFTKELNELKADLILEAALEKLDIKRELFSKLEHINSPETIFATNTSSIPITQIALGLKNPSNLVGIHFFNPAQLMKLVEIIKGAATSEKVATIAFNWAISLGKHAVYANDAPGFIVNRVARPFYVEGLKLAEENVADFQSIDRLCEASGFRLGPFRLMDLIGVETNFSVTSSMYQQFHQEPRFRPNRIQQQMVDAGRFGRKTGKGFYDYEN